MGNSAIEGVLACADVPLPSLNCDRSCRGARHHEALWKRGASLGIVVGKLMSLRQRNAKHLRSDSSR